MIVGYYLTDIQVIGLFWSGETLLFALICNRGFKVEALLSCQKRHSKRRTTISNVER
jgi:hypothetical protein